MDAEGNNYFASVGFFNEESGELKWANAKAGVLVVMHLYPSFLFRTTLLRRPIRPLLAARWCRGDDLPCGYKLSQAVAHLGFIESGLLLQLIHAHFAVLGQKVMNGFFSKTHRLLADLLLIARGAAGIHVPARSKKSHLELVDAGAEQWFLESMLLAGMDHHGDAGPVSLGGGARL